MSAMLKKQFLGKKSPLFFIKETLKRMTPSLVKCIQHLKIKIKN